MQTSPESASITAQAITRELVTQVFADWETDYRANPDSFYTPAESAAMEVAPLAEARAIHFLALLRQRKGHSCPTCGDTGQFRAPYSSEFKPCPDCAARPSSTASATTDASVNPAVSNA